MRALLFIVVGLISIAFSGGTGTRAQVKRPKPPELYDVQIRYRIQADRNERVLQFEAMTKYFGGLGFKETETDESDLAPFDPTAEFMTGTIPSKTARDLLADRRVRTILLAPAGYKAPDKADEPVRVRIELMPNREQPVLANQAEAALRTLGFRRDLGFDTEKFTVLRGTMPSGNVPRLLRDLRYQPSGWFLPESAPELNARLPDGTPTPHLVRPFGDVVPVRVVEVLGVVEAPPASVALPPIPSEQPHLNKWTADLRRRLAEEGARDRPLRLEVVLATTPQETDKEWRRPFAVVGAVIEGRVGSVVTVLVPQGGKAVDLAALPEVSSVRLPRVSSTPPKVEPMKEAPKDGALTLTSFHQSADADPIKRMRVDRLHAAGMTGQGVRVVVLDSDFAGWQRHLAAKGVGNQPPGRVRFIDLTADRNRDVKPEPMPGELGHGTRCAMALRLAAPNAELMLVRIPPDAPYHVVNVARYIRGDRFQTEGIVSRRLEIDADIDVLQQKLRDAKDEYRKAFDDFSDDEKARQRRIAAQQMLRALAAEEIGLLERLERVEALERALAELKSSHIVLSQLYWNTGFAFDAASTVSRFLDDWLTRQSTERVRQLTRPDPPPPPLWFQPAGDTRGQTWTGLFRDADNNGVMEFASADAELRPGRWSRELNFLATRAEGKDTIDLAAGSKIRISVQWREPHDPTLSEEDYRVAVAPLRLQLVKQRDPSGEKYASDEIDLIAESEGQPARLHYEDRFAVYEHSLELTLPADGRYGVRIEGVVPDTLRPANVPTLKDQQVKWELRSRLFVESADGQGRFVLADFASADGGVAVPADARSVFAIGALGRDDKPAADSATGAGPGVALRKKPDLLAPGATTDLAAAYAAGFAAAAQSAGLPRPSFPHGLDIAPGGVLTVPDGFPKR
jgi:hypothetical protein